LAKIITGAPVKAQNLLESNFKCCVWKDLIDDILTARPQILVIGTGYAGNMRVPDAVRQTLENHQIKVIAQTTADSATTFNRLAAEGKDVAGAFHLTC